MNSESIIRAIIDSGYQVHTQLGPGLLESTFEKCLVYELLIKGLQCQRQLNMPLVYKGCNIDNGYRVDLLVESKIIVEIKAVDSFHDLHLAQVITYLKLSKLHYGLLLNFNVRSFKNGIKRVIYTK